MLLLEKGTKKKKVEGLTNLLPFLTDEDNQASLSLGSSRFGFDWLCIIFEKLPGDRLNSENKFVKQYYFIEKLQPSLMAANCLHRTLCTVLLKL